MKMPKINLTIQLLLVIAVAFCLGNAIPEVWARGFLAVSHTLKEGLVFLLPIIVFSCIVSCMVALKSRAFFFLAALFGLVSFSNFGCTLLSYAITRFSCDTLALKMTPAACGIRELVPLWDISFYKWIPNDIALYAGLLIGTLLVLRPHAVAEAAVARLKRIVDVFLQKFFLPVLPLFIFGFVLKLKRDGTLNTIVTSYLPILLLMLTTFLLVLCVFYLCLARFRLHTFMGYMRNALPAALVGFSTMSSIAAMPTNLVGVAKNTNDSSLAAAAVPAVVNIHLIGDSLGIPMLALAVMMTFGLPMPDLHTYMAFGFFFMLAKFATAAVPCGTIMIMLPVLEKHLGFTPEMSGLIMALYMLVDPLVTATSVMGNNAFAILVHQIFGKPCQTEVIV